MVIESQMQQTIPMINDSDIVDYNNALQYLRRQRSLISFKILLAIVTKAEVVSFSDSASNITPQINDVHTRQITGFISRFDDD